MVSLLMYQTLIILIRYLQINRSWDFKKNILFLKHITYNCDELVKTNYDNFITISQNFHYSV